MTQRFDVVWVNLDPTIGGEIKKTRPCVVVSPNELNNSLETLIVAPLTSTIKMWPFRFVVQFENRKSSVAFDQIRTVSKQRIGQSIGKLKPKDQQKALQILQAMFAD